MSIDALITLVSVKFSTDEYGQETETETKLDIFAKVKSASQTEFFQGYQNGMRPAYVFSILSAEYDDQRYVEWDGHRYEVYRTYLRDIDHLEIYCQMQEGSFNG